MQTRSASALLTDYAGRYDRALADGRHSIGSALGAWLLLALVAPAATGAERSQLETALGTRAEDAARLASELLGAPHPAVAAALALWHRDEFLRPTFWDWASALPSSTETGRVPTQADADAWAARTTKGLISRFPIELDERVVIVLANALATRIDWSTAFTTTPAAALESPWATQVQAVLRAPSDHTMFIAHTDTAGDVAVHAAAADDGVTVVSVIANADVDAVDVRTAALDVAALHLHGDSTARRRPLRDLPLGDAGAWSIAEQPADDEGRETYTAFVPAWRASSEHDLLALDPQLGIAAACRCLSEFVVEPDPRFEAKQVATAAYHRLGFEAAAVTAIAMRTLAATPSSTMARHATLRFGHPYAVVAVATDDQGGPWHGVPVFSAWVAEPAESDPG